MAAKFPPKSTRHRRLLFGACVAVVIGVTIIAHFLTKPSQLRELSGDGLVCDQRFVVVRRGQEIRIPYCANVSLDEPRSLSSISHVVVVIHGSGYRARKSFRAVHHAAKQAQLDDKTIILAPQFLKPRHVAEHDLDPSHVSWSRWTTGGRSRACKKCPPRIRSHEVVEQIVAALLSRFELPNLRFLSFAGHSAGGQFINRFSATGKLRANGLAVRFVVANPSNFLYFNDRRPQLPRLDRFAVPTAESIEKCPRYNRYYYGLTKLASPVKHLGAEGIKQQYAERTAYYLIGANDDDPNHEQLMKTCASRLQGVHRKQRALAYMNHLTDEFGRRLAHHKYAVVQGVGHRSFAMLTSACGVAALFHVDTPGCSFQTIGRASPN